MKIKTMLLIGTAALAGVLASACSYSAPAVTQDGHVVVLRNDGLLFGALRKAYVCQVTPSGLSSCGSNENP